MSAATVSSTQAGYGGVWVKGQLYRTHRGNEAKPLTPSRLYLIISPAITVPSTSVDDVNDRLQLFQMPSDIGPIYVVNLTLTLTDMDTNVSPALVNNLLLHDGTSDGTILITGTTVGQASGSIEMDTTTGVRFTDISGKYLCLKTTTASATPAAGTATIKMTVYTGSVTTLA